MTFQEILDAMNAGTLSPQDAVRQMAALILEQGGTADPTSAFSAANRWLSGRATDPNVKRILDVAGAGDWEASFGVPSGAFTGSPPPGMTRLVDEATEGVPDPGMPGGPPAVDWTQYQTLTPGQRYDPTGAGGTGGGAPGPAGAVPPVYGAVPPSLGVEGLLDEAYLAGLPAFGRAARGLGLNIGPGGGAFGRFIQNRFDPAATAFTARQALTGGETNMREALGPFQSFLGENLLGGGVRRSAANTFQGLLNLARGGGTSALQNQFIAPQSFAQGQDAAQLARSALGSQIGGFALSRLSQDPQSIWRAFAQSPGAANTAGFLPWAQSYLGIRPRAF
jgi:hypothetical protein